MGSFIVRDGLSVALTTLAMKRVLYKRFHNIWPKTYVNGTHIYAANFIFYDGNLNSTPEFKKFIKILGMKYSDLESTDYDELSKVWFKIVRDNPSTAPMTATNVIDSLTSGSTDYRMFPGDKVTIRMEYGGALKSVLPDDAWSMFNITPSGVIITPAMLDQQIVDTIMLNPSAYILSEIKMVRKDSKKESIAIDGKSLTYSSNIQTLARLETVVTQPAVAMACNQRYGFYALFDTNGVNFTLSSISAPVRDRNTNAMIFTVEYTVVKGLEVTDPCIAEFLPKFNQRRTYRESGASLPVRITREDYDLAYPMTTDALWETYNGASYLKVDTVAQMKKKDFVVLFGKILDSDYSVKEAEAWEKVVAVVVVIIAIIIAIWTWQVYIVEGVLIAMAAALSAASLVLTVGSAILAYAGGLSAQRLVKVIGKIAQYTGYAATILGIMAVIQGIVRNMISQITAELAKEVGTEAAQEMSMMSMEYATKALEVGYSMVTDAITSAFSFTSTTTLEASKTVLSWVQNAFKVYQYYDQNFGETARIAEKTKETQAEIERLESLNEENAPHMSEFFGMGIFEDSMGSFDALSELNKRIEMGIGGYTEMMDPAAKLT